MVLEAPADDPDCFLLASRSEEACFWCSKAPRLWHFAPLATGNQHTLQYNFGCISLKKNMPELKAMRNYL